MLVQFHYIMNVLLVLGSIMAVAHVSMPGTTGTYLEFADYSLYSNLSDNELMQLAIERSLSDAQSSGPGSENSNNPAALNMPASSCQALPSYRRPQQQLEPSVCPANPPSEKINPQGVCSVSHFVTGSGKRMVAYRRYDGTMEVAPEPEEDIEPIVKAILDDDVGTVRLLVKQPSCNLLTPNKDGWIPLHEAAYCGQDQCIKILLRAQPGMVNQRTLNWKTALMLAVTMEHLACVKSLLENGADPDIANMERETPLYKACEKENPAMVAMLLNYGASVNKNCIQGWTALHESVCRNNVEICEILVKAGAKVNMPNMYGITPIFVAAQSGKVDALRMLLRNGADLNSQAADGATALYEACKNGHEDIVEFLLSQNADTNKPGKTGLMPIHIAAQRGNDGCVYGSNPHPPIKTRRNVRYDVDETTEKTCVQFCEVISTETYSRWAGPIIDVLLDYVGHVKLCARLTEHLDSYHEWQCIKEKSMPPRPLMQLCRLKIRKLLGINRLKKICKLPVPPRLIKFLNHQEREREF
ncbi:ankyrin repeat and SOCS box protein 2 isoform X3 [Rhinichthys klamathensis goyatoka]|uniref:ankyrin repeat and SOCS box protein 2 isoform X3 n=1 Tax=Rhinichthys klamathensis goyatoka TaxID=3034132 RepID=UPI0024B5180E|nr:ankyrin repeat and SOCS box protein 2 isoform X3 [Rhinichthys klamathensis goyatoka]